MLKEVCGVALCASHLQLSCLHASCIASQQSLLSTAAGHFESQVAFNANGVKLCLLCTLNMTLCKGAVTHMPETHFDTKALCEMQFAL